MFAFVLPAQALKPVNQAEVRAQAGEQPVVGVVEGANLQIELLGAIVLLLLHTLGLLRPGRARESGRDRAGEHERSREDPLPRCE